jgi:sigma-B regulation protein RsbU (phosphoserine phosphatase)
MIDSGTLFGNTQLTWRERLDYVVAMMREVSRQTDPQAMVAAYRARMRGILPVDGFLALSRRGLRRPAFRITRSSKWSEEIDPWREVKRLPLLAGGILAELLYGDEPRIIDDLSLAPDDPAGAFLDTTRSLVAIPNYDQGLALNMTILLFSRPGAFPPDLLPGYVWMSNLFGRATHNLVLSRDLKRALETVDRELRTVAEIQRSLLPRRIPQIPRIQIATSYQTSRWAGGDYYDFFPTDSGRLGMLMADVSGHGTPAAVMMAITHALAHRQADLVGQPDAFLHELNQRLCETYTREQEAFVTAYFGVFDPERRTLTYASAGHPAPRLKRCSDGSVELLDRVGSLPLGLFDDTRYEAAVQQLVPGDQLVIYTDGITDAENMEGVMFGPAGLDRVLANCGVDAGNLLEELQEELAQFTGGRPQEDDQTILIARVI